jgi:hypothetical protein
MELLRRRAIPFIVGETELAETARQQGAQLLGPRQAINATPHARGVATLLDQILASGPFRLKRGSRITVDSQKRR